MRNNPQLSFLLMQKNPRRYDLPKGHIEPGETELECALRELYEETGITGNSLHLDEKFSFTTTYQKPPKQLGGDIYEKTVVIFLGWLTQEVDIKLTEHDSYTWMEWKPHHDIQHKTIKPLLQQLQEYFQQNYLDLNYGFSRF
jgi:8-oxo-dGTP pyrophosphatase MutT (NUDIX family)